VLALLGFLSIATLLALILFRVTSVLVALTLVPLVAGLAGGFGREVGAFALDGIRNVTPTAALLAFAVIYFGVMNDAGLFEPIIRRVVAIVGRDPLKIVVGTAAIAAVAHLDGAGASTFMVTVPAMLPLYLRLRLDPLALTAATALAAGTMNMLPWGGPTARAATALHVSASDLFIPDTVPLIAGLAAVLLVATRIGLRERARLASLLHKDAHASPISDVEREKTPEPSLGEAEPRSPSAVGWWLNAALTLTTLAALFLDLLPLPVVFLIACALALLFNCRDPREQRERLTAHGSAAMMMVTTVFAAGMFTGILTRSGMLGAMATSLVQALPASMLRHLPVATAVASMPLSLVFDPDSFYFGVLPVLANAAAAAGGSAVEVGRAALLGQMTTGFPVSPLTPSTFLLVGLAEVDLADHQRRTIPYAFFVTLVMSVVALLTGAIGW
jgi:CitMHS family citrate-Mg2+:H+ or citrate-Ca2+:H+ symporter